MAENKAPASDATTTASKAELPKRPDSASLIPGAKPNDKVKVQDMNGNVLPNPVPRSWLKTFSKLIKPVPSSKEGK